MAEQRHSFDAAEGELESAFATAPQALRSAKEREEQLERERERLKADRAELQAQVKDLEDRRCARVSLCRGDGLACWCTVLFLFARRRKVMRQNTKGAGDRTEASVANFMRMNRGPQGEMGARGRLRCGSQCPVLGPGSAQHCRRALSDRPAQHAHARGQHAGRHVQRQTQGQDGRPGQGKACSAPLILLAPYVSRYLAVLADEICSCDEILLPLRSPSTSTALGFSNLTRIVLAQS